MNKIREIIAYKHYFRDFLLQQPAKVQDKIFKVIEAIEILERIPQTYLKHIQGTDNLFEARVQLGSNIWRVFCFFDTGRLVILLNGFQKKTQKTPTREIDKALGLIKEFMKAKDKSSNLHSWSEIKDQVYGKKGNERRDNLERESASFKIGLLLKEARESKKITQEELAIIIDRNRTYISRVENDGSNITLKTLFDIVEKGLGGRVNISIEV